MNDLRTLWMNDYYSDVTRKARRNVLAVFVISYLLIIGELIPRQINFLGITIDNVQRETILYSLLALTLYYICKFYIYVFIDTDKHVNAIQRQQLGNEAPKYYKEFKALSNLKLRELGNILGIRAAVLISLRAIFEYIIPLLAGISSIVIIINAL